MSNKRRFVLNYEHENFVTYEVLKEGPFAYPWVIYKQDRTHGQFTIYVGCFKRLKDAYFYLGVIK